jgi:hypothetical protein
MTEECEHTWILTNNPLTYICLKCNKLMFGAYMKPMTLDDFKAMYPSVEDDQ